MKESICNYIRYVLFLLAFCFLSSGWMFGSYNTILFGIVLLYAHNILYCFENIGSRVYLLMFYITIYVFLLSRPTIAWMRGEEWWKEESVSGMLFAVVSMFLTLLFLHFGALFMEKRKDKTTCCEISQYKGKFKANLQIVSQIIFYISMCFYLLLEMEKLVYMHGRTYTEYYVSFQSQAPRIIHLLASFMVYSLCVFLATLPRKRHVIIPLGLYFLSAFPSLIIGIRNPIMLNAIFILLYFFMRDILGDGEKWIGKLEKWTVIIALPVVLIFMAAYARLRSGETVAGMKITSFFSDFFYGQGVTFNVLAIGHDSIPYLPDRSFRNYTLGGFVDYIFHGRIAQHFFGAEALEGGNNLNNALISNRFAHNMSYVAKGEKYLQGEGWGSSYLLETYVDFGYVGIIIFSIILGALLIYGVRMWKKSILSLTILLLSLTQLFLMPRSGATEFIEFLISPSFWVNVAICYLCAGLCCKSYELKKGEKKDV